MNLFVDRNLLAAAPSLIATAITLCVRLLLAITAMAAVCAGLLWGLPELNPVARLALGIFGAAVVAWTVLDLDETPVAMAAALAMIAVGAVSVDSLLAGPGHRFLWLLVGAFVLAAALQISGLGGRCACWALASVRTPRALMLRVTWLIVATAFVVPSTSGRAALMLPVFLSLAQTMPGQRHVRALALLFPSVILLSACASLPGAGAHLVALDFMQRLGGPSIDYLHWAVLAAPFGVLSSLLACESILRLFLTESERDTTLVLAAAPRTPLTRSQWGSAAVVTTAMIGWCTQTLHGIPAAIVAIAAALAATVKPLTGVTLSAALMKVEWRLVLLMAAIVVMSEALVGTGAAHGLAQILANTSALQPLPAAARIALVALLALLAHLVLASRTARTTVLIPTMALPFAGATVDAALLVFVVTIGSGFCQTMTISSKPVAMFAGKDAPHYTRSDLAGLSLALLPGLWGMLVLFALYVWPPLGLG